MRSFDENLSQDIFAKLWHNPKTELWLEKYLAEVSSEEIYTHCLRNRYFLDTIKRLVDSGKIEVLINFGSGFSMYPFLLNEELLNIEIDKPEIVNYKRNRLEEWQKSKVLPKRNLHLIGVDFSEDYEKDLISKISSIKTDKSCFILVEGVLFFLTKTETDKLFNFFDKIQNSEDYIGSASFQDAIAETMAYKNLLHFFGQKLSNTGEGDFQTIQDEYYLSFKNYNLMDHQDYFSLSKKYGNTLKESKEMILNENFYLLKKS
ncbi:class I SAM-dependent methyltransferase [Flagellimonas sp. 2504JD1-5]